MTSKDTMAAVVRAYGDLDLDTAPALCRDLTAALPRHRQVVLDLSGVDFMDCSGIGALVHAQNQADHLGVALEVRGAGPAVRRLIELTGLGTRVTLRP
ncbi:Anti-sigma factor antagonist [Kitasatospora sp. MMS16-BH015]|uniref:STAS domain-containing protein n=1 Tax=Kitasatospora sp. MMS16-BH015 TaxID=2018025 RepID=UPI000CA2D4CB|nr:STAS domain-containing protein [Kitasatospora sp. MMS16-BH015]AUG81210.1 Anti-sigma factor antagonist [Kitasatospora sp. MMS16-BH015]